MDLIYLVRIVNPLKQGLRLTDKILDVHNIEEGKNSESIKTRIETLMYLNICLPNYTHCKNSESIKTRIET